MTEGLSGPLRALLDPGAYPHPVAAVELVQTHVSWILLTGELACKIKRPVRYPFVDLRSARHREFLCHEEVRLNRRFAPEIYIALSAGSSEASARRSEGIESTRYPAAPSPAQRRFDAYLECARGALSHRRPALVLISGLSGSGKTWLASRLAASMEAVHLRSDVERKRLAGLEERARSGSPLRGGLYSAETSARVYEHLAQAAREVLEGGYSAIVDATFLRREDRLRMHELSVQLNVPGWLVKCVAPEEVLRARIVQRQREDNDASEADLAVLRSQLAQVEPVEAEEGFATVDANTVEEGLVERVRRRIDAH